VKTTERVAAPDTRAFEPEAPSAGSGAIILAPLIGIALLLFAAASVSPAHVPWPRVAAGLHAHRSDLVVMAFGASGIAFVVFSLQLMGT
jgi:hypothetical protein